MAKKIGSDAARRARIQAAKAAAARKQRRQQWGITGGIAAAVIVVIASVTATVVFNLPKASATVDGVPRVPRLTAIGNTSSPPWPAPGDAATAVQAAGLPMLGSEGSVEHIHAHLDVIVDGTPVPVPADIGIATAAGTISPLHTHDTTGVIHIESPVKFPFSLGQFFSEWQVSLAADHVGSLKSGGDKELRAYVNGKPVAGNPAAITMNAHDEIALVYGTAAQQKNPPSSYSFTAGE
jgi:hypothetical protein